MQGPPIIHSPLSCRLSRLLIRIAPFRRDISDVRHVPKLVFPSAGLSLSRIYSIRLVSRYIGYGDVRGKAGTLNDKLISAQWLLYVLPGLAFRNPTFCPHSVFIFFVWISQQIAIISLYSVNWLVYITDEVFTARYELNLQVKATTVTISTSASTFTYSYYYYYY
jgi:hypothetical protein